MEEAKTTPDLQIEDEQTAATPPILNDAALLTMMDTISKRYLVREPRRAFKMTAPFTLGNKEFPANTFIVELTELGGEPAGYVAMSDEVFVKIYRPARKPRKA